jgi:putative SOS response-associated peptidase YedK
MCGRYIVRMQEKYLREWHIYGPPEFLKVSYNVMPTQSVPIVRWRAGRLAGSLARWGLIPFFAKGEPPKYSTINARVETMETSPAYGGPWSRGQRCLQLASGFYEWHLDATGRKAPFFIELADQELFAFAALWDRSFKPDGSSIESCVHITMPANELMRDLHNTGSHPHRMPAMLRREDWDPWVRGTAAEAKSVIQQYPANLMSAHEVSARVNSARNDGPELIEGVQHSTAPHQTADH